MTGKWINCNKIQPKKGNEYLVVWVLDDGDYPVTTCMDYDAIKKIWVDRVTGADKTKEILYWRDMPKPPKGIKKHLYANESKTPSKDLAYGSCVHGFNLSQCDICNPNV